MTTSWFEQVRQADPAGPDPTRYESTNGVHKLQMNVTQIALFDAKPYDRRVFDEISGEYPVAIKYFEGHLDQDSVRLPSGLAAVCAFVNDYIDESTIDSLERDGVRLIALRSAG